MISLLFIQIWTSVFGSFYLPMDRDAVVTYNSADQVVCIAKNNFKRKELSLLCEKNLKKLIYFSDKTPEINATILTDKILIKIKGQ